MLRAFFRGKDGGARACSFHRSVLALGFKTLQELDKERQAKQASSKQQARRVGEEEKTSSRWPSIAAAASTLLTFSTSFEPRPDLAPAAMGLVGTASKVSRARDGGGERASLVKRRETRRESSVMTKLGVPSGPESIFADLTLGNRKSEQICCQCTLGTCGRAGTPGDSRTVRTSHACTPIRGVQSPRRMAFAA